VLELPKEYIKKDWNQLTSALIQKILNGSVKQQAYRKLWDKYSARLTPRVNVPKVYGGP
jgi:hypothetical protein